MLAAVLFFLLGAIAPSGRAGSGDTIPIVIWHGLGDDCCSDEGMREFVGALRRHLPSRPIFSIRIGENELQDRWHSLYGNANRQVQMVCSRLAQKLHPKYALIDAIGLSQGGQFLRAFVQRCNVPRVRRLITLGSQHYGVVALPGCPGHPSLPKVEETCWKLKHPKCSWWKRLLLGSNMAYSSWVQNRIIPAQYYRDPTRLEEYLECSSFLPDINNENSMLANKTYKANLASLQSFAMFMFTNDTVVVPRESAWFGHMDESGQVVLLRNSSLYREDRLGLKTMDGQGRLQFLSIPGQHMNMSGEAIGQVVRLLGD